MPVDSSIQYNGYNSYRFVQDELLASFLFGVQDMTHVTASFQAFCTSAQTAAVRAYLRFWDINNATIQTQNISFALASAIWEKKTYTATVPTGAVKAQLFFTNPISVAWYMAQPKVEEGEVATAYAQNLAGQMTYITPGGVYTGTVRAEQIIITSEESLEDRFIAINQNQILLAQGLDTVDAKTTKITAGGVYTGEISATQITVDQIVGPQIADGAVSNAKIANLAVTNAKIASLSATKVVTGRLSSVSGQTYFDLDIPEIVQNATISGKSIKVEMSPLRPFRLTIGGRPSIYVTDASGFSGANILVTSPYDVNQDGRVDEEDVKIMFDKVLGVSRTYPPFWLMDIDGDGIVSSADLNKVYVNANFSDKLSTPGGRQLGVDGTGVFVSTNWGTSKSYIHTF